MSTAGSGHRRWTDEQLRDAVASAHSWRGVMRALGITVTAAGSLKCARQRAAELGLDTSHFRGQRRWSDVQLRQAVQEASSWAEALERLGVTDHGEYRSTVKRHAARLGLDVSHLSPSSGDRPSTIEMFAVAPDPAALGKAARTIAVTWFTLRGMSVASSAIRRSQSDDLLVATSGGRQRVQVRSAIKRDVTCSWPVEAEHRERSDETVGAAPSEGGGPDLYFIVAQDGGLFLFPGSARIPWEDSGTEPRVDCPVGDASSLLSGPSSAEADQGERSEADRAYDDAPRPTP